MHDVLGAVTSLIDPLYGTSVVACDAAEARVIARQDSSEASDALSMLQIRSACDKIFAAFELVRTAQVEVRALIDAAQKSTDDGELEKAIDGVDRLRLAAETARHTWNKARPELEGPKP